MRSIEFLLHTGSQLPGVKNDLEWAQRDSPMPGRHQALAAVDRRTENLRLPPCEIELGGRTCWASPSHG